MSAATLRAIRQLQTQANDLVAIQTHAHAKPMDKYRGNLQLYAKEVLGMTFWDRLAEAFEAVEKPPYRVAVNSGHKIGKTNGAGALINYHFDVYDPGVIITTGASYDAMKDTVWSEVRMQRARAGLPDYFIGPVAPEMRTSPDHWAKLFSVNNSVAFHGKHRGRMFFLFDEATGIEPPMFTVGNTMFKAEPGFGWICFCNPTDASCQLYAEEQKVDWQKQPKWKVYSLSSLDHPNIVAQRAARARGIELFSNDLPIPNAISITQIDQWVRDWCLPIDPAGAVATDFEWIWPDGTRNWWRPQMDWEARCMGVWPSQTVASVWSDYLIEQVINRAASVTPHTLPEIGGDVARFGDDKSAVHTRWGSLSLSHAARQGLRTTEMAGWLIETARELADLVNHLRKLERNQRPIVTANEIPMKIDDDGVGGGVVDILFEQGMNVIPVNAGSTPNEPARYLNKRSELWFSTSRRALDGGIAFCTAQILDPRTTQQGDGIPRSRLDMDTTRRLKLQAVAPKWKMGSKGHRIVEQKEETKARLGYSPDDMDAMNLAYYETGWEVPRAVHVPAYDDRTLGPPKTSDDAAWNDEHPQNRRRARFGR